jgi:hypothetical protein
VNANFPSQFFHQLLADGKAKSNPLRGDQVLLLLLADGAEQLKELLHERLLHAHAGVLDGSNQIPALSAACFRIIKKLYRKVSAIKYYVLIRK